MYQKAIIIVFLSLVYQTASACVCDNFDIKTLDDIASYKFIGLAKIESQYTIDRKDEYYGIRFELLELYRGDSINSLAVSGGHREHTNMITSCGIGIDPGEVWILLAYETDKGMLATGRCTYSMPHVAANGKRNWQWKTSFKQIAKLKELLNWQGEEPVYPDGPHKEYYPDGQVEVEAVYLDGQLNGKRTTYYPDGQRMTVDHFKEGKQEGPSLWYFDNGRVHKKSQFQNGHEVDSSFSYKRNGQLSYMQFFSKDGVSISSVTYYDNGRVNGTRERNLHTQEFTSKSYYETGELKSVRVGKLPYEALTVIQYHQNGRIEGLWLTLEHSPIKREVRKWDEEGELIYHFQRYRNNRDTILVNHIRRRKQ